jgi:hypothetical protein
VKWQRVVTAVAAAAGGAAWVSAVGSGVVALRLREADLPTEPVVALMSTEHRFAIGAGILAAPLLAASIGFLADSVLTSQDRVTQREDNKPPLETLALEGLAVVAAVAVAFELLPDDADTRHGFKERVAIFLPVLVGAGVGAIIAESLEARRSTRPGSRSAITQWSPADTSPARTTRWFLRPGAR